MTAAPQLTIVNTIANRGQKAVKYAYCTAALPPIGSKWKWVLTSQSRTMTRMQDGSMRQAVNGFSTALRVQVTIAAARPVLARETAEPDPR